MVIVGYYFEKRRALATGISASGSGIGTFVIAPLLSWLVKEYGWRLTLWLQAGLVLNCVVFGALLRPVKARRNPKKVHDKLLAGQASLKRTLTEMKREDSVSENRLASFKATHTLAPQKDRKYNNKASAYTLDGNDLQCFNRIRRENSAAADEQDQLGVQEGHMLPDQPAMDQQSNVDEAPAIAVTPQKAVVASCAEQRRTSSIKGSLKRVLGSLRRRSASVHSPSQPPGSPGWRRTTIATTADHRRRTAASTIRQRRQRIAVADLAESLRLLNGGRKQSAIVSAQAVFSLYGVDLTDLSRPLYRRDAFYSGSIDEPPAAERFDAGVQPKRSVEEKRRASVYRKMSIPHALVYDKTLGGTVSKSVLSDGRDRSPCFCVPASVRNVVTEMVDVRLLIVPEMLFLIASNIIAALGFLTPFVYLTARAEHVGIPKSQAAFLLSIVGIGSTLGRVFFGWMADQPWTTALAINNCALLFCGAITFLVPWFNTYPLLVMYSALFGFVISSTKCLQTIVLVDLLTLDNLTNSFGLLLLFRGTTSVFGAPLSGAIYDWTKSYDASFWFAGVFLTVGGLVSCLIPIYRWHKLRQLPDTETGCQNTAFVDEQPTGVHRQSRKFSHKETPLETISE